MWIVQGLESGEYIEFTTRKEAQAFIEEARRFDRENGLTGEEWAIVEED